MNARAADDRSVVETLTAPAYALLGAYVVTVATFLTWALL